MRPRESTRWSPAAPGRRRSRPITGVISRAVALSRGPATSSSPDTAQKAAARAVGSLGGGARPPWPPGPGMSQAATRKVLMVAGPDDVYWWSSTRWMMAAVSKASLGSGGLPGAQQGRSAGLGGGVVDGEAPVLLACPAADGPARRVRRGRGPRGLPHHPGAARPGAALHRRHDAGRCPGGTEFGLELFTGFTVRATAARELASEELRLLIHAILDHQENEFGDDAAIMLLERRPSRSTAPSGRR